LDKTWRMHPRICDFISDIAYDGRLGSAPSCAMQNFTNGIGLRYVSVERTVNRISCTAQQIACMIPTLLGRGWTDAAGAVRKLTLDDFLVVAPYNAQVAMLVRYLPAGTRFGTVDKFQGD
jgi:superfamily I DNA and/or RNA helicase